MTSLFGWTDVSQISDPMGLPIPPSFLESEGSWTNFHWNWTWMKMLDLRLLWPSFYHFILTDYLDLKINWTGRPDKLWSCSPLSRRNAGYRNNVNGKKVAMRVALQQWRNQRPTAPSKCLEIKKTAHHSMKECKSYEDMVSWNAKWSRQTINIRTKREETMYKLIPESCEESSSRALWKYE